MGRYDVLLTNEEPKQEEKPAKPARQTAAGLATRPSVQPSRQQAHPSIDQQATQPASQFINQSTGQSVTQSTEQSTKVVDRPKAFYITQRVDRQLDRAVRYLQERHGIRKADRSTVVNAILDREANWTEEALDRLVSRVISQLTSRLTDQ